MYGLFVAYLFVTGHDYLAWIGVVDIILTGIAGYHRE